MLKKIFIPLLSMLAISFFSLYAAEGVSYAQTKAVGRMADRQESLLIGRQFVRQIYDYANRGMDEEAKKAYTDLMILPDSPELRVQRAQAIASLVFVLGIRNEHQAKETIATLFKSFNSLGASEEIEIIENKAKVNFLAASQTLIWIKEGFPAYPDMPFPKDEASEISRYLKLGVSGNSLILSLPLGKLDDVKKALSDFNNQKGNSESLRFLRTFFIYQLTANTIKQNDAWISSLELSPLIEKTCMQTDVRGIRLICARIKLLFLRNELKGASNFEQALKWYSELASFGDDQDVLPIRAEGLLEFIQAYIKNNRYLDAERKLDLILRMRNSGQLNIFQDEALRMLSQAYLDQGMLDAAKSIYQKAKASGRSLSEYSSLLCDFADKFFDSGKIDEASRFFAIANLPEEASVKAVDRYINTGKKLFNYYLAKNDFPQTKLAYERLPKKLPVMISKNDISIYFNLQTKLIELSQSMLALYEKKELKDDAKAIKKIIKRIEQPAVIMDFGHPAIENEHIVFCRFERCTAQEFQSLFTMPFKFDGSI